MRNRKSGSKSTAKISSGLPCWWVFEEKNVKTYTALSLLENSGVRRSEIHIWGELLGSLEIFMASSNPVCLRTLITLSLHWKLQTKGTNIFNKTNAPWKEPTD